MTDSRYLVTASPHLKGPDSTPRIMWNVVGSLIPILATAIYFFGPSALLVTGGATLGAVLTEATLGKPGAWRDGSAMITGILLGLCLPAGMPMWMAFVGGAFGIGFGKLLFGGLGQNVFNPALLGRAFLQAAFPVAITTWPAVEGVSWWSLRGPNLALPLMGNGVDAATMATPLGLMKFEHVTSPLASLAIGSEGGSLGETSAIIILICGGYLALRNYLNWRIPASIIVTAAAFAGLLHLINPTLYPSAPFMVLSGGLLLGAVFMATDMVTSPITNRGVWIFGIGIGLLVVAIRIWGGLPEGVMYAILIMNALVPSINRLTHPRVFGTAKQQKAAA
ncbi:MAG TPA: RnfABCDGE type electron transport complex subunit D [Gemmatimonadales bacterium]|nr:RnfABCDGE type electron transport complex subunit D [Gemmatimonadales bacterium]